MQSDFVALTDMINAKMLGMFDLIDKWIPQQNTIKKTLLHDINFIEKEIQAFHTIGKHAKKSSHLPPSPHKKHTKCRNGKNCWYLKQGRCWFLHTESNMKDTSKQHDLHHFFKSASKQLPIIPTIFTSSNNSTRKKTSTIRKKSKNKNKSHAKSHNNSTNNHCNMNGSKKKKKRQRRKKKSNSNSILECFDYNSDHCSSNYESRDSETQNDITGVSVNADCNDYDEYDLNEFTIDTIDQNNITIDEGDILEKIMNIGILEYEKTLEALREARTIYENAFVNDQTLEEAKQKVETALTGFIE